MKTKKITGYKTSKDYDELVRLLESQNVVCIVDDCKDEDRCRDIAQARHIAETGEWEIFVRGIDYIWTRSKRDFQILCKMYNVEFLIPNEN